jgi:hypothetical protein
MLKQTYSLCLVFHQINVARPLVNFLHVPGSNLLYYKIVTYLCWIFRTKGQFKMKYLEFLPKDFLFTLRFFIPAFLTLMLGKILFELLAFNFQELNQYLLQNVGKANQLTVVVKINEIQARLLWLTSVMLYFFIITGLSVFLWNILKNALTKMTLLIFVLIGVIISAMEIIYLLQVDYLQSPLLSIFNFTFNTLLGSRLFSANELFVIHTTLNIINLITIIIPLFIMLAGCCILFEKPLVVVKEPGYFREKSSLLKKLVTGSSAMMVIGIVHMQLWLNWPVTFIGDAQVIEQFKSITLSICRYWGVVYTLTIAALYLPAANYLSNQAKVAIETGQDEEIKKDPVKWLVENKMLVSPIAQLPQIVAVVAPMLVGSLTSTLSGIISY